MHKQIKISEGVYVTDFRPNSQLIGLQNQIKADTKDVGLILDKISTNQSKIKQLLYSIQAIKEQEDWKTQNVLLQAIEQNYQLMVKFSSEMKEWILDLNSLKYKPENDKIEQLLDANRISIRQDQITEEYNQFLKQFNSSPVMKDEALEQQEQKILVEVTPSTQKQQQDKGIYL